MATASALLHLPLLSTGPHAALQPAIGLSCLFCAVHLWRRPGHAAWTGHVAVAALMPLHGLLGGASHGHAGTGTTDPAAWAPSALLLLAGLGVLLGVVRWALDADVPLRPSPGQSPGQGPGQSPGQMPAAAGGSSGRRVPQA
ncbi:hypothetical protein SAMN05660359_04165 [Geodermatophilus obscurus]|uniref:Uncharacterized protein n=1 Tax=Geodermatophilus obscurus TaxID=1861 RepID=A0A1I5HZF9_9ACTN|nr:hypothetical protein [Geodermatophilus obscurus]SFO53712.1 hypothetical protein SAMN05660359_04165 [Geodermatophilus obscurus]